MRYCSLALQVPGTLKEHVMQLALAVGKMMVILWKSDMAD